MEKEKLLYVEPDRVQVPQTKWKNGSIICPSGVGSEVACQGFFLFLPFLWLSYICLVRYTLVHLRGGVPVIPDWQVEIRKDQSQLFIFGSSVFKGHGLSLLSEH